MFTNWLTSETASNRSREENNAAAPDVIIEVGTPPFSRFPAHSAVLLSQSGYFRAAITRVSESGKLSENPIFLPNINVEHFTPLLTYMYTGYLELNFENIFGVLLASHLLHMPRAVEICRDFLAQTQRTQSEFFHANTQQQSLPQPQPLSKVIRPIASKPPSNFGLNFISPPKAPSNLLLSSHGTNFKSLANEQQIPKKINETKIAIKSDEKLIKKSTTVKLLTSSSPVMIKSSNNINNLNVESANSNNNNNCDKVVIDIASCDGPVRFRRVLNEAFERNKHTSSSISANSDVQPPQSSEIKYQNSISFHQQMVRNINEQYNKQKSIHSGEESENSQHSTEIYTCVYCNHTFKSKYCYQKHAKRHINPLNPLGRCRIDDGDLSDGEVKKVQAPQAQPQLTQIVQMSIKRDSIKPLDMNVQYYPCKYCGCKFPSYYFVHKHRKLCHPEVEADGSIIQHTSLSNSSTSSQIQQNDSNLNINIEECSSENAKEVAQN